MSPNAAPDPDSILSDVIARDRGRLLAALSARLRNIDLAEEALSDAVESAMTHWQRSGAPGKPAAWLLTVAKRKALDRLRRDRRFRDGPVAVARLLEDEARTREAADIPDDRLRLIFACCHPALDRKSSVALTLRLLGGLSTPGIARAFLDQPATMGQRISRAKAKIAAARIPFAVPEPSDWPERLDAVLDVIYLVFNAGYVPPEGDDPARDLCLEAIFLARLVDRLCPEQPEIEGLLALLLLIHARREARQAGTVLDRQDPDYWDRALIIEGQGILARAVARRAPGPYQIQAAIQDLHIEGRQTGRTDWHQIARLYSSLLRFRDTAVVRLNQAVAIAEYGNVAAGLERLAPLAAELDGYQPFHAAHADLLARAGNPGAGAAYDRAIALATSPADAAFLAQKRKAWLSQ